MAPHSFKRNSIRQINSRMSKKSKGDFLEVNGISENGSDANPCKYIL